jgi:hypothetical protein
MAKRSRNSWLSWKHQRRDFKPPVPFDKKVDLFYERLFGWQLDVADHCINGGSGSPAIPHSAFAALQILLSYFETIGKYEAGYTGDHASKTHFKRGLRSVFPRLLRMPQADFDELADHLYDAARCGLYHASQTGRGILLARQRSPLRFVRRTKVITLDPHRLPALLKHHLDSYRKKLLGGRDPSLVAAFEARFALDNPGLA